MAEAGAATANPEVDCGIVAESVAMRFTLYTISPRCEVLWHFHTEVSDWHVCREGAFAVETRSPNESFPLTRGRVANVPAKRVHCVVNTGPVAYRFALVQGIGNYDFNRVA